MSSDSNKDPEKNQQPASEEQEQPRPRIPSFLTTRSYQGIVDQRIADAEAKGSFRNLPGTGRPLRIDDDSLVPEEDRAAFRMLKNANMAPPWIELQKQIREDQDKITAWLPRVNERWQMAGPLERERLREEYRDRLRDLAKLVDHYNLIIPRGMHQLPSVRVLEELKKLG